MLLKYTSRTPRRAVVSGAAALALLLLTTTSHAEDTTPMSGPVAEIVTFKLAQGVSEAEFLKQVEVSGAFLRRQAGFVSRRLTRMADGTYMDYVTWTSLKEAEQAMTVSMTDASLGPFIQSIDPSSMKLDHHPVVSSIN